MKNINGSDIWIETEADDGGIHIYSPLLYMEAVYKTHEDAMCAIACRAAELHEMVECLMDEVKHHLPKDHKHSDHKHSDHKHSDHKHSDHKHTDHKPRQTKPRGGKKGGE